MNNTALNNSYITQGAKDSSKLTSCMQKAVDTGAFPGAVLCIQKCIQKYEPSYEVGYELNLEQSYKQDFDNYYTFILPCGNRLTQEDSHTGKNSCVTQDTIYDLGELTLVFCTASLFMKLVKEEKCSVDDLVSRYLQGFSVNGKSLISIKNLLTSQSGLISSYPFYEEIFKNSLGSRIGMLASRGAKEYVLNRIVRSDLKTLPNTKVYYSEIANLLLGFLIEVLSGNTLDKVFYKEISKPLGLQNTGFIDLALLKLKKLMPELSEFAPTEDSDWRGKILCAEVQNSNAWAIGGIAGNAGLFSNASDVSIFAKEILKALKGESEIFDQNLTKEFLGVETKTSPYLWERASKENLMQSCGFSDSAVGINSFTGCSLWIDPKKDLAITLLSNRIHPSHSNKKIIPYRTQIFTEALRLAES